MFDFLSTPLSRVLFNKLMPFAIKLIAVVISLLCLSVTISAQGSRVDFGDDASTWANDDADSTSNSMIVTELTELGSYEVIVTSFAASLSSSGSRSDDDKYEDSYAFNAESGQSITIEMTSTAMDTYLEPDHSKW